MKGGKLGVASSEGNRALKRLSGAVLWGHRHLASKLGASMEKAPTRRNGQALRGAFGVIPGNLSFATKVRNFPLSSHTYLCLALPPSHPRQNPLHARNPRCGALTPAP